MTYGHADPSFRGSLWKQFSKKMVCSRQPFLHHSYHLQHGHSSHHTSLFSSPHKLPLTTQAHHDELVDAPTPQLIQGLQGNIGKLALKALCMCMLVCAGTCWHVEGRGRSGGKHALTHVSAPTCTGARVHEC